MNKQAHTHTTIVKSLDEKSWREYVKQHPQGNIFHTPEMFQVFSQAKGYRPTLLAALNQEDEITVLFIPVQITLMEGLLRPLTTRAIAYGSVLCSPGVQGSQALAALLNAYSQSTKNQVLFTEMRNLSDLSVLQPVLLQSGFEHEQHLNYLIDLIHTPMEVMQNIGTRTRKHIRQALRLSPSVVGRAWYKVIQALGGALGLGPLFLAYRQSRRRLQHQTRQLIVDAQGVRWKAAAIPVNES
mgnify:CR=1 FL=1